MTHDNIPSKTIRNIRHCSKQQLLEIFKKWEEPPYRASQVWEWIWIKGAISFDAMTNLSKKLREKLYTYFYFNALHVATQQQAKDKTIKVGFRTHDGHIVEGVLIPTQYRRTACISSQVGCSLDCSFCATGNLKRKRNLSFDEIVDQIQCLEKLSLAHWEKPMSNIVFMGMGEPLLNYKEVIRSIHTITHPELRAMSPKRITVSTVGITKKIKELADDEVRFELAVSLHACNDCLRSKLMSINQHNNLKQLEEALAYFYKKTKNKITLEYILLSGINDSVQDAQDLIALYQRVPIKLVNLIEYNNIDGGTFQKASEKVTGAFVKNLQTNKVNVRVRRSRGSDINAACGQLAAKKLPS